MSVITHRNSPESRAFGRTERDFASEGATASNLTFARQNSNRHFWRRARALIRRAYGPLIVYAILIIALVTAIALRVAVWVPMYWR
ncbi:MAG: hypothetical protein WCG00_10170 [Hyphomicrobiales bacterium]|nr:hypothetical protein [Hyphomicrobiales bacterium]